MLRVVENFRQVGFKGQPQTVLGSPVTADHSDPGFWRQLNYIGDTKAGTLMGIDQ